MYIKYLASPFPVFTGENSPMTNRAPFPTSATKGLEYGIMKIKLPEVHIFYTYISTCHIDKLSPCIHYCILMEGQINTIAIGPCVSQTMIPC